MKNVVKRVKGVLSALLMFTLLLSVMTVTAYGADYSITVNTDGNGTTDAPANASEGQMGVLILIEPNDGYVFDNVTATGITEGEDGTTYSLMYSGWPTVGIMINEMPAGDVIFDVTFAAAVTATYDANGGTTGPIWSDTRVIRSGKTEDFSIDDDLIAPPDGKEYDGVEVDGVRYGSTDSYTYDHNVTIVYQWKDPDSNAGTMCEVTYDANGGTLSDTAANGRAMERGKVEEIRFVEELATAPSGMVFDGIEVEGVKYGPTDSWTVPDQDAVTVKFLWREVGGVCTLTLDINGGTKGEEWTDTIELTQGDEESVPDNVENMAIAPPCKVFSGLDLEGKTYEPGEIFTVPAKETAVVKFIWADGEHTWGEWETVKEPTATDTGLKKRICSVCGEEETEVIPATGNGGTDDNGGNSGTPEGSGSTDGNAGNGGNGGTPATGDENSVLLYMLISGIALSGVIITRRNLN